jgi:DNA replication and repair protein RecF
MRLIHLDLTDFRNFTRLELNAPGGPILLVGDNAQGKTSLLEAVYYLATFDSFHASNERQLVNFLAAQNAQAVTRIRATFESLERTHHLEVRLILENSGRANGKSGAPSLRKEILYDRKKVRTSEALGQFNAVLFLPHMLSIVDGAPEERRRYLNLALSQVEPAYEQALSDYNKAVAQRNALLKQLYERQGDLAQLDFWDEILSEVGGRLIQARSRAALELDRFARSVHHELTRGAEVLRLSYQPAFDPLPVREPADSAALAERAAVPAEQIRRGLLQRLGQLRNEEISRGVTTIGPHRDELRMLSNGIDLGLYGSRGQVRTTMLSLKLAEIEWMKDKTGQWPVLLLDEVLAELDHQRRQDLLKRLAQCDQALLTTTDVDLFSKDFIEKTTLWRIHAGRLIEEVKHVI